MRSMFRIFAVLCFWTTSSVAQQYEYDVGGYDFNSDSFFMEQLNHTVMVR